VQDACTKVGQSFGAKIECIRADKIGGGGTIHADIWAYIALADVLVFDLTGLNGNVLVELGVAAAMRSQDSVILLRDRADPDAIFPDEPVSYRASGSRRRVNWG